MLLMYHPLVTGECNMAGKKKKKALPKGFVPFKRKK